MSENTTKPDKKEDEFEDISHQIYPERKEPNSRDPFTNWGENFVQVRCETKIKTALRESPLVRFLLAALKSKGW